MHGFFSVAPAGVAVFANREWPAPARPLNVGLYFGGEMLRLAVHITAPQRVDLLDAPIPPVKGLVDFRRLETEQVWTPAGLPLSFYVDVGPKGDTVVVQTSGTWLLRASLASIGGSIELLLPTEERLRVSVIETR